MHTPPMQINKNVKKKIFKKHFINNEENSEAEFP